MSRPAGKVMYIRSSPPALRACLEVGNTRIRRNYAVSVVCSGGLLDCVGSSSTATAYGNCARPSWPVALPNMPFPKRLPSIIGATVTRHDMLLFICTSKRRGSAGGEHISLRVLFMNRGAER